MTDSAAAAPSVFDRAMTLAGNLVMPLRPQPTGVMGAAFALGVAVERRDLVALAEEAMVLAVLYPAGHAVRVEAEGIAIAAERARTS